LTREAAVESLSAVRHILSVIPVKEPLHAAGAASRATSDKSLVHA
jgi:hypothetical protein